jgi:DNA-binding transcriptional LysR family regulator
MSGHIELRHLRYFVAVAEELNFRRAAERLFISQPALSRQIRELEDLAGARLLDRDTANVRLTPAGQQALLRARRVLQAAGQFSEGLGDVTATPNRRVRVAVSIAISPTRLPRLESGWQRLFGKDAVQVEPGESKLLLPRLLRGELDFALLGAPNDFGTLETAVVSTVPVVITLPADHPAARRKLVALKDVTGLPLFWFPRKFNPPYYDHCANVFAAVGFKPKVINVPPGQLSTLERIREGEGFALLTTAQAQMNIKGVAYRPLKEGMRLGISVVAAWKPDAHQPGQKERAAQFAAVARKVLSDTQN